MPEAIRNKETVQQELEKTQKELNELVKKINKQGYKAEGEGEKLEELEKEEEKLKKELEDLKEGVSSGSESLKMSKDEAIKYLETIKDNSWGNLNKEGKKWIAAVQVVLKDKGYSVGTIDGILGKSKSKTRRAIRAFQKANGLRVDGKPGKKTINALLGKKYEKDKGKDEKVDKNKERTEEKDGKKYTGTYKDDGTPNNGVFEENGKKYKVEDGKIGDEIKE